MIDDNIKTFETFFGEGAEEEQLHMRELAEKLNIKHNDAIWIIIYVFNYFGRLYSDLPQRVENSAKNLLEHVKAESATLAQKEVDSTKDKLATAVIESAKNIASNQSLISYLVLAAAFSIGVFCLCLLCFVAGAAIAGKGWGRTPIDALLLAPAGWILPICITPMAVFRGLYAFNAFRYGRNKKELIRFLICISLIIFAILTIFHIF